MEIDKIRCSSYRPSTNSACERFHRTLNSMLAKVIKTLKETPEWVSRDEITPPETSIPPLSPVKTLSEK